MQLSSSAVTPKEAALPREERIFHAKDKLMQAPPRFTTNEEHQAFKPAVACGLL